jgi:hypothetical protein
MAIPMLALLGTGFVALSMSSTDLLGWLVRPVVLQAILIANLVIVVWRVAAVADPYRLANGRHSLGRLLVVVGLALVVAIPHVLIARYTLDAAYLLDEVFVSEGEDVTVAIDTFETPTPPSWRWRIRHPCPERWNLLRFATSCIGQGWAIQMLWSTRWNTARSGTCHCLRLWAPKLMVSID